jgi:hypothetical protein
VPVFTMDDDVRMQEKIEKRAHELWRTSCRKLLREPNRPNALSGTPQTRRAH